MFYWWAWTLCVVFPGTEEGVWDNVGSSLAAVVVAVVAAEYVACGGPGVRASVGTASDVTGLTEPGTEQGAGREPR